MIEIHFNLNQWLFLIHMCRFFKDNFHPHGGYNNEQSHGQPPKSLLSSFYAVMANEVVLRHYFSVNGQTISKSSHFHTIHSVTQREQRHTNIAEI